ncbi:MAG TPA: diguanylate cyclase [Solirubrobacteraceae bacterium]
MSSRKTRALFGLVALALAVHAVNAFAGPGEWPFPGAISTWLYLALMYAAGLLGLLGALRHTRERLAWAAVSTGLLLWATGDVLVTFWIDKMADPPYPSMADAVYLSGYVGVYTGIILLLRSRVRPVRRAQWIEGTVGFLALAALATAVALPAFTGLTEGKVAEIAVNLAYPFCDLLLLSFVGLALGLSRRLDRSWALLILGQLANVVADITFAYQDAVGSYVAGSWLDTLWPLSGVLTAAAAWQTAPRARLDELGGRELPLNIAFASIALGVLMVGRFTTVNDVAAVLAGCALVAVGLRGAMLFRDNLRLLGASRRESLTDGLSGLANRRALMLDLEEAVATATAAEPRTLALFDLDGFKQYNDAFGHAAGDALLKRLAAALETAVDGHGRAYRLGGDEFCVLLDRHAVDGDEVVEAALLALFEPADPYAVDASYGLVALPLDADTAAEALRLADHRMYALKHGRRATQGQAREVLLALLGEREPDLQRHMRDVASLARAVGRQLGLDAEDLDVVVRAAELHDIGKVAIPDAILHKPGPLTDEEWSFVHKHTLIGERIVSAAEALRPVGRVVRSSHERWDGGGYPDGLRGEEIPLGARIVLVCDAWDAMTSDRSYRRALPADVAAEELRANTGTQFDPEVVGALLAVVFDTGRISAAR